MKKLLFIALSIFPFFNAVAMEEPQPQPKFITIHRINVDESARQYFRGKGSLHVSTNPQLGGVGIDHHDPLVIFSKPFIVPNWRLEIYPNELLCVSVTKLPIEPVVTNPIEGHIYNINLSNYGARLRKLQIEIEDVTETTPQ